MNLFNRFNVKNKIDKATTNFLEDGFWTPQTFMLRNIAQWVRNSDYNLRTCLSVDRNPTLEPIIISKWPKIIIEYAIYPDVDACNLSKYPDNTFDLVFSHQILEHIPRPWVAAQEMIRVLKLGGIGIHTTCAFNPRHGQPHFGDYYRFLKDGLAALFEGVKVLCLDEWGNREAILYNVGINDGHGDLGGRRFHEAIGANNDGLYPWVTWIIYEKR